MKLLTILFFTTLFVTACGPTNVADKNNTPEVLTIYPDGTMEYRDRIMNEEEVIIYSDGKGGERAAVRVWNPLQPPSRKDSKYYRDTIVVERIKPDAEQ